MCDRQMDASEDAIADVAGVENLPLMPFKE